MKTTIVSSIAALAIAGVLSAQAAQYTRATTNAWFSVDVSTLNTSQLNTSPWATPSSASSAITGSRLVVEAANGSPVSYTTSGQGSSIQQAGANVLISYWDQAPDVSDFSSSFGAVAVVTNTATECLHWIALVKNGGSAVWKEFTAKAPVEGEEWEVLTEIDMRDGQGKVRYSVKGPGDTNYTVLVDNTTEWFDSVKTSGGGIAKFNFSGEGSFGDFYGKNITEDGKEIVVDGLDVDVERSWAETKAGSSDPATVSAYLSATQANGLKGYQSYLLGLDPNTASSKPIIKSVTASTPSKVAFTLGCGTLAENTGVQVKYTVKAKNALDGAVVETVQGNAGENVEMALPTGVDNKVRYYTLDVDFIQAP